jgi:hypothetical protein
MIGAEGFLAVGFEAAEARAMAGIDLQRIVTG